VYIDNAYKGLTPVDLNAIPNGNHLLLIKRDGYQDYSRTIVVMGDTQPVTAALVPAPTPATTATTSAMPTGSGNQPQGTPAGGYGSLTVTTSPAGAQVFIDGALKGITPATIPGLASGNHSIVLKMDGFQDLTTVITITSGQTAEYSTGLSGNAKTPGFEVLTALLSLGLIFLVRRIG